MKKNISSIIFVLFVFPTILFAQISQGGIPKSWQHESMQELSSGEIMPNVDVQSLKTEDAIESQYKDIALRFAYGHSVSLSPNNSGEWYILENGDRIWRLKIASKGALSINLTFSNYYLPEEAELFIYSNDKQYTIGAFTSINNKESGKLGTAPIPGDVIIVEYYEPENVSFEGELEIGTVAHAYRDIFNLAKDISDEKSFGDAGNCNNNVVCEEAEEWEAQVRSVAMITTFSGTRFCTGSLLNNVNEDETPYFLTANHCVGAGVSTWVFIFNYFSDICDPGGDGNDGSTLESISGASLLANTLSSGGQSSTDSSQTDMALLLLDETIPESYDVFYNGWDWSGIAPPNTVGIHHPSGDVMKISWDNDEAGITGYFDLSVGGTGGGTTHWRIFDWEDGTTEGGSSGSPLFNDSKQVIGQLHGGIASCSNNVNDYYGRLALSFQFIKEWLDPDSTGITNINGFPAPVILGTDPGLQSIQGVESSYCNENTISPSVNLKNYGLSEVSEVDIYYFIDGNLEGTYNWIGSLLNGQSESIEIGEITILESGSHILSIEFSYEGDENLLNNQRDVEFYTTLDGVVLDISILSDNYASETTWAIYSMDGDEIASGGPYSPDFEENLFEEEACVPDTCVEFVIYDSANDGICCNYGDGAYSVSFNGVELASGGEFGSSESTIVCPNLVDNIEEINPLDELTVYPNPAKNRIYIDINEVQLNDVKISLINIVGQRIRVNNISNDPYLLELNVQDYDKGMYIIELTSNEFSKSYKVIIE